MDLLNKARKKAEAAYKEISALAADPDKKRAYQNYNQQNQQANYGGFNSLPWEQYQQQQNFPGPQAQFPYHHQPPIAQQQNFPQPSYPAQVGSPSPYQPAPSQQYSQNASQSPHGQVPNQFQAHPVQHHHTFPMQHPPTNTQSLPPQHMTPPLHQPGRDQFLQQAPYQPQRTSSVSYQPPYSSQTSTQDSDLTQGPQRTQSQYNAQSPVSPYTSHQPPQTQGAPHSYFHSIPPQSSTSSPMSQHSLVSQSYVQPYQQQFHPSNAPSLPQSQTHTHIAQKPVQDSQTVPSPPPPPSQTNQYSNFTPNEPYPGLSASQPTPTDQQVHHSQPPSFSPQIPKTQQYNHSPPPLSNAISSVQQAPASNRHSGPLESQISNLSIKGELPHDQSNSQTPRPDLINDSYFYPRPLQIQNRSPKVVQHELGTQSNHFAVELPGCNTFSPPHVESPQRLPVELYGCQPVSSTPPTTTPVNPAADPIDQPKATNPPAPNTVPLPALPQSQYLSCSGDTGAFTKHTQFYVLKASQEFGVCKACYFSKVTITTEMASQFTPYSGADTQMVCDLSFPGVQGLFSKQCVPHNTIQPLIDFTSTLSTLTSCNNSTFSGTIYVSKENKLPGFAICPMCYELNINHTAFEGKFEIKTSGMENQQKCHMGMPYYKRVLYNELQNQSDFGSFIHEVNGRLNMTACTGQGMPVPPILESRHVVFTAVGGKTGNICPACYCDYLAYTSLADAFVAANIGEDQIGKIFCDLAGDYAKVAMSVAIKRGDDEIWRNAVELDGKLPPCVGARGVDEADLEKVVAEQGELAQWFQMTDYPSVKCCPRCYHLSVSLFGAGHLHSPTTGRMVAGVIRQCVWKESSAPVAASVKDPNNFEDTTTYRGRMLRNCLAVGYSTDDYTDLLSVAKIFDVQPPPCAGNQRGFTRNSGRKFFGRVAQVPGNPNDTTIVLCQECHWNIVDDTPLAPLMSQDLTEVAYDTADTQKGFFCQPYSKRAKAKLKEAAEAGDLAQFAKYWTNREELRKKREAWQPILAAQDAKQKAYNSQLSNSSMLKVNAQANALMRIGGAMIHEAAMDDTGFRYGNSVVGTNYLTAGRAESEIAMHHANNMQVGGGGDIVEESKRLLTLFKVDNEAFLAVE